MSKPRARRRAGVPPAPRATKKGTRCSSVGCARRLRRPLAVEHELLDRARPGLRGHPLVEGGGPREGRGRPARPVQLAQVVHDAPRSQHEHALVAQRGEGPADLEVVARAERRLHGQLRDGNVRVRVHPAQRHPAAVVDAAVGVHRRALADAHEELLHAPRQRRGARRLVAHAVERLGEAREVVDRLEALRRRDGGKGGVPVGRHDQDRRRPAQHDGQLGPRVREGVVGQRERGRAMRQEDGGKAHVGSG